VLKTEAGRERDGVALPGQRDPASGVEVADREGADGRLVAGIDGFTWGGYAMIEWLWVHDDLRGSGLGQRLMEAAEQEAGRRGCVVVRVNTHTFQAPGFYARLGYVRIGFAEGTPRDHGEVFLEKRLDPSTPD
jgi:GNAT superfamily N-acetyltransferase